MKILKFFILFFNIDLNIANQDLCRDAAVRGQTFAADPSSCERYLFCHADTGITETFDCRDVNPNTPFFFNDTCIATNNHCIPLTNLCPPTDQMDVMIAVRGDTRCQQFRPCRLPGMTPFICQAGAMFDRNSGVCVEPRKAPCVYDRPPPCVFGSDGFFPVAGSCTQFIFCFEGQIIQRNECRHGWHFSRSTSTCVPEDESDCPYIVDICRYLDNGAHPLPGSCTKFVFCFHGEEIIRNECQEGYWFDPSPFSRTCVRGECPFPLIKKLF